MSNPYFDIQSLGPLYEAVQSSGILPDSKTFVDCTPKLDPRAIAEAYAHAHTQAGFDLMQFVQQHFEFPKSPDTGYSSAQKPIVEHLNALWSQLERRPDDAGGTLIPLPYPYIVPGGRFREVYYWDSYFTMLGLQVSGRIDLMENMIANFAWLIDAVGFIPNGNRTYYLGRSQPPFFALMVELLAESKGDAVLLKYRPQLEKEYAFWMDGSDTLNAEHSAEKRVLRLPDGALLNRYWDNFDQPRPEAFIEDTEVAHAAHGDAPTTWRHIRAAAESGWDFSSRWFRAPENMASIQTADLVPVDLNCLLFHLENTLARAAQLAGDETTAQDFAEKAAARDAAINRYCWDEAIGFYTDYHFKLGVHSERLTLAAVFPLFFNLAAPAQADAVAEMIETHFLQPGGLTTTLLHTGQQWDAPNGWAPLQWMGYAGLRNYAKHHLADAVKNNWMALLEKTYLETGKMMEKYNVMDLSKAAGGGEYPNQDGFGWTNGVYLKFKNL
jgi:alpha,alpha-trehalase